MRRRGHLYPTLMLATALATTVLAISTASAQEEGAAAETPEPRGKLLWSDATFFRYNPLGLITSASLEYQYRLHDSEHPALSTNYLSVAFRPIVTPAFARLGATAEIMPLSLLRLGVGYELIPFFGAFGYLQSFQDAEADMWEDTLDDNADAGENYATFGRQLSFTGLLQAKAGPIAVRSKATLANVTFDLEGDDTVFFDPFLGIALPERGWYVVNDLDALYVGGRLVAGLRHTYIDSFIPDEPDDPNGPIHRLGPLIVYEIAGDGEGKLQAVKAVGLFQLYLKHRYRAGQEMTRWFPYTGIGIIVEGQLL